MSLLDPNLSPRLMFMLIFRTLNLIQSSSVAVRVTWLAGSDCASLSAPANIRRMWRALCGGAFQPRSVTDECSPRLVLVLVPGPALGGAGTNGEQCRSAQVPSQLAPRSVELGAGTNRSNWLKAGPGWSDHIYIYIYRQCAVGELSTTNPYYHLYNQKIPVLMSDWNKEQMFYLTTHSTHTHIYIYNA